MALAERLQAAMKRANISQAELARECGVRPPSVHAWLSGKSNFLRGDNLLAAARALKVSQAWLASGVGPMTPSSEDLANLPPPKPPKLHLSDILKRLTLYLRAVPADQREAIAAIMSGLARNPEAPELSRALITMLEFRLTAADEQALEEREAEGERVE